MTTGKQVVLFVTPVLRYPANGGPTLRILNSLKALSGISHLYLYGNLDQASIGGPPAVAALSQLCVKMYLAPKLRFWQRAVNAFLWRVLRRSVRYVIGKSPHSHRDIIKVAKELRANVIWLGYGNISYSLLKYIKKHSDLPVVLDTDSVWSRFVLRGKEFAVNAEERARIEQEGHAKEQEERWGTKLADVTTCVSEVDAKYYQQLTDDPGKIFLFSNVVDINTYVPSSPQVVGMHKPYLYLAGSFWRGSPMEEAARWFVKNVWLLLIKEVPDLRLCIVGHGSQDVLADVTQPGVTVIGEVPSVLPWLCHAAISLVPLHFESGTRFKILEAGACRIPVVSTTLGAEGLPVVHGRHLLLADTAREFGDAIASILRNPEYGAQLASRLHDMVANDFGIDRLTSEGASVLKHISGLSS